ncbi:glycosyltransferase family 4 protein [Acidocella sp.]|uniref:glycosyltransferase family 4 protein n=1 Tax=Acidocella sp. TaxID=50710 RepID=UPI003D02F54B
MNLYINGRFATQPLSGVQRFAVEVTRALQAHDPRYTLLTPPGGGADWSSAREVGTRHGQGWEQLDLPRAAAGGVLFNLGNTGPLWMRRQLVVIHDAGVFSTPAAYSRKFRIWYKVLQNALILRGAAIVTVSEFSRQEILRHLPARSSQVHVMPEGADHMRRIGTAPEILAEHGLEPGRFVLGVGTLAAHKNLAVLGLLAQRLEERGIPLVMAGSMGGEAFQAADKLPQPARYIGRVSDEQLKALYEHAGCFIFPSRYEGFGLPPVEAMACGCPVVAANIPVMREIGYGAVQFCNPHSPEDVAAQVLAVLDSPARQQELRAAGRARAATLTWARAAATLDGIAKKLFEFR